MPHLATKHSLKEQISCEPVIVSIGNISRLVAQPHPPSINRRWKLQRKEKKRKSRVKGKFKER
jgi:hypothetical protein